MSKKEKQIQLQRKNKNVMGMEMELPASELGTKEYWDKNYEREIENYKNHGDVGEVWFDEDSQVRVISWILKQDDIESESRVVDLGTGNGMLLVELAREGFKNLVGLDYSENAINLAKDIASDQKLNIDYFLSDILDEADITKFGKFCVAHDKGTYDAISLHPENSKEKRDKYIQNIYHILKDDGYFIITSCNWTEDELITAFSHKFQKSYRIPTPTFKFGGKVGSVVTSIVLKKKLI